MRTLGTLAAVWCIVGLTTAAAPEPEKQPVLPASKLPAHIAAPAGQLSVFADFADKRDLSVPVYIVNRTGKSVEFFTFNGRPILPLEYEVQPGKWQPARLAESPICYDVISLTLPRESFTVVPGSVAVTGFKAKVRYRVDGRPRLMSNAGEGLVSHDDLSFLLVYKSTDFGLLSQVALGEFLPPAESADFRPLAIRRLALGFEREKAKAVLQRIADGSEKQYAKVAWEALEALNRVPMMK